MDNLNIDPSGLLTDDQIETLLSLVRSGVPMLPDYSKVFFGLNPEDGNVVVSPLSLLPAASSHYNRVLVVDYNQTGGGIDAGAVPISVTIELSDSGSLVYFSLWVVGRQLRLPIHALVSIQNQMNNVDPLDEKTIQRLLEVDYTEIIGDSFPSLRLVVI